MTLLFNVLYAAHAKGSHHKLALDALRHLSGPDAEGWRRMFLKHAELYMQGAKAPDDEFKDFKNHVLHVRDGYWGGAPDKVENWYGHLVDALKGERWSEAVWAAGVLSHYYTDPIHPFHTAQSEAENNIHRAAEWSISRSYDALRQQGEKEFAALAPTPGEGPRWLREFVCQGAETSNKQYEKLIAHYDINRGVVDPPSGLDMIGRRVMAELVIYASRGFSAMLARAFAEAAVAPPSVGLTLETVLATIKMPAKMWAKRIANAEERALIERMYDELRTTGRVEETLPEDDRMVRDLHAKEVLAPRLARRSGLRAVVIDRTAKQPAKKAVAVPGARSASVPPAPAAGVAGPQQAQPPVVVRPAAPQPALKVVAPPAVAPAPVPEAVAPRAVPATSVPQVTPVRSVQPAPVAPIRLPLEAIAPATAVTSIDAKERAPRIHLAMSDDVERAPSIGPKTAELLYAIGIKSVGDLLAAEPADIARKVGQRHIDGETVEDWQDQSRLVAAVPGLRGTHAQLLVGAGYRSRDQLAAAAADKLCSDVLAFAVSTDGQRVLRDGNPPDIERIKGWLESAIATRAA